MTHKPRSYIAIIMLVLSQLSQAATVIVHPEVNVSSLTPQILRSVFTMRSIRWPDNSLIHVFVLPDQHPFHNSFVKTKLNMFPYQLRMIWDRSVYSGAGFAPVLVVSEKEMLSRVKETKGAIGYVSTSDVLLMEGVKTIEIE